MITITELNLVIYIIRTERELSVATLFSHFCTKKTNYIKKIAIVFSFIRQNNLGYLILTFTLSILLSSDLPTYLVTLWPLTYVAVEAEDRPMVVAASSERTSQYRVRKS